MALLSDLVRDIRFAARVLLKSPLTSAVAVLALALGIGVNASSFISANAIVLHPFPFPRLNRIATVAEKLSGFASEPSPLSPADYAAFKNQTRSFEQLAAYRPGNLNLTGLADPERVRSYFVTPSFFGVLGIKPKLGRTLTASEEETSRSRVAVVSYAFWTSHLAASPQALGKPISLGGQNYTVVGVMPDEFDFPLDTQLWLPLVFESRELGEHVAHDVSLIGLLKPGVSVSQAAGEAAGVASRLAAAYPTFNQGRGFAVEPVSAMVDRVTARFISTILGSALFVLLLACANIGNLQLARAAYRQKEIAVRAALGASPLQVARQLLIETILLAAAAAPIGLLLASWNNDRAKAAIPPETFRLVAGLRTMHVDASVVGYTCLISVLAGVLCSLPMIANLAARLMRVNLTDVLRERAGSNAAASVRSVMRSALIVFELVLALVLLVGAGLMMQTFDRLLHVNQGFDPKNILSLQLSLPDNAYTRPKQITFYDRLLEGFHGIRGVQSAALLSPAGAANHLFIEGRPEPRPGEPLPDLKIVNSGYLATLRVRQLAGRFLSGSDRPDTAKVVVLSESMARHYWPNASALGRRVKFDPQGEWLTVVGVCSDIIDDWFSGEPTPAAYLSYTQYPAPSATFLIRTVRDPLGFAPPVRAAVRHLDRNLAVYQLGSMQQFQDNQRGGVRAAAETMTTYSVIALLLAATGIYAVISYFVAARTHDIGVYMALGASRASVLKMTMAQSARLIAIGVGIGMPLAFAAARLMSSALYGVITLDPRTFALYAVVLVASAFLASYLPCRRATLIDPLVALRED